MIVPLLIDESDLRRGLERIANETALGKKDPLFYDEAGISNSPTLERASAWLAGRQRVSNLYVANLPGPPVHFFLGPALIHELFPLVPLVGNVTIGSGRHRTQVSSTWRSSPTTTPVPTSTCSSTGSGAASTS